MKKIRRINERRVLKDYEFIGIINNIPREKIIRKRQYNKNRELFFLELENQGKTFHWRCINAVNDCFIVVDANRAGRLEAIGESIIIKDN